jgi:hypothetical protein
MPGRWLKGTPTELLTATMHGWVVKFCQVDDTSPLGSSDRMG